MKRSRKLMISILACILAVSFAVGCNDVGKGPDDIIHVPPTVNPDDGSESGANDDPLSHTHNYGDQWMADDTYHWKECSCGSIDTREKHVLYENGEEGSGASRTCAVCGALMEVKQNMDVETSYYWGTSLVFEDETVLTRYSLNGYGMPIEACHYAVVDYGDAYAYSQFFPVAREYYNYTFSGALESVEVYCDRDAYSLGLFDAFGYSELYMAFEMIRDGSGRLAGAKIYLDGEDVSDRCLIFGYGDDGRVNSAELYVNDENNSLMGIVGIKDGRISSIAYGEKTVEMSYDENGDLATMSGTLTVTYEYDGTMPVGITSGVGEYADSLKYSYNGEGRLAESTLTVGGEVIRSVYTYSGEKLATMTVYDKINGREAERWSLSYVYSPEGALQRADKKEFLTEFLWWETRTTVDFYEAGGDHLALTAWVTTNDRSVPFEKESYFMDYDNEGYLIGKEVYRYVHSEDTRCYVLEYSEETRYTPGITGRLTEELYQTVSYGDDGKPEEKYKKERTVEYTNKAVTERISVSRCGANDHDYYTEATVTRQYEGGKLSYLERHEGDALIYTAHYQYNDRFNWYEVSSETVYNDDNMYDDGTGSSSTYSYDADGVLIKVVRRDRRHDVIEEKRYTAAGEGYYLSYYMAALPDDTSTAVEYNPDGSEKSVKHFDRWGKEMAASDFGLIYDEAGELVGKKTYDKGVLDTEVVFSRDDYGFLYISESIEYSANDPESRTVTILDMYGRHVKRYDYRNGRLISETELGEGADGPSCSIKSIFYNGDGSYTVTVNDPNCIDVFQYKYDAGGRLYEELHRVIGRRDGQFRNDIVRSTVYNEDGGRSVTDYDENGEKAVTRNYGKDGTLIDTVQH